MAIPPSFAPLAARLAARVAEIRPMDGARNDWDKVGALLVCLVLEFLICLCEALDARAAAVAAGTVTAPARREVETGAVPAPRLARQAPLGEIRAPRPSLAPETQAMAPSQAAAPSGTTGRPTPAGPRLVWSRDPGPIRAVLALPWRPVRETRAFAPVIRHVYIVAKS